MVGYGGLHALDGGFRIGIWLAQNGEETVGTELLQFRIHGLIQAVRIQEQRRILETGQILAFKLRIGKDSVSLPAEG